jgi:Flp pilus assembly protein TadB
MKKFLAILVSLIIILLLGVATTSGTGKHKSTPVKIASAEKKQPNMKVVKLLKKKRRSTVKVKKNPPPG